MRLIIETPAEPGYFDAVLEGLVAADAFYLLHHPRTPLLYRSGVRYGREPAGREVWLLVPQVLAQRTGDCEDLAAWRAAELRVREGIPARAVAMRTGARRYHAIVRYGDVVEDPSRKLGMKAEWPWRLSASRSR